MNERSCNNDDGFLLREKSPVSLQALLRVKRDVAIIDTWYKYTYRLIDTGAREPSFLFFLFFFLQ